MSPNAAATAFAAQATPDLDAARTRFNAARDALCASFPERSVIIDDILAALVCGEHVCILGPPGTAKSALTRAVSRVFSASYFEYLLNPFTEPNELFGPVDVEAFKQGTYRRNTTGMLPEAQLVFLDEAFKANSAILNALLSITNERLYHAGGQVLQVPLETVIMASNELPRGESHAFWDRCLVRHQVRYLQHDGHRLALLAGKLPPAPDAPMLTLDDVHALRLASVDIALSDEIAAVLVKFFGALAGKGIVVSDRRQVQAMSFLRAVAAIEGATAVEDEHLSRLSSVLWSKPEDEQEIERQLEPIAAAWRTTCKQLQARVDSLVEEHVANTKLASPDLNVTARLISELKKMGNAQVKLAKQQTKPQVQKLTKDISALRASLNKSLQGLDVVGLGSIGGDQ